MKKIRSVSRGEVVSIPIPEVTETYSPISNALIINEVVKACDIFNYSLIKEEYEVAAAGQQVKMKFYLSPEVGNNGFEICILNSYNKTIAVRLASGIYSYICWNLNYIGEITDYRRHTGSAPEDVQKFIVSSFDYQEKKFENAQIMQNNFLLVPLTKREQAELAGRLIIDEEIISLSQLSLIHNQIKKPEYKYDFDINTMWGLYNHTTHAVKTDHPLTYLQTQQSVQSFFIDAYEEITQNKLILA